jgi:hypothetical protein
MHSLARTRLSAARIVFLTSIDETPERRLPDAGWLVELARGVTTASGGDYSIELVSCGPNPGRREIFPGVARRVLPAAGQVTDPARAISWDLPAALAEADLVHIHGCRNRTCEAGLLIACHERKAVCISEYDAASHSLAGQLGLLDLAGVVICHSAALAAGLHTAAPVEVLPARADLRGDSVGLAAGLVKVYRRLLEARESAP